MIYETLSGDTLYISYKQGTGRRSVSTRAQNGLWIGGGGAFRDNLNGTWCAATANSRLCGNCRRFVWLLLMLWAVCATHLAACRSTHTNTHYYTISLMLFMHRYTENKCEEWCKEKYVGLYSYSRGETLWLHILSLPKFFYNKIHLVFKITK